MLGRTAILCTLYRRMLRRRKCAAQSGPRFRRSPSPKAAADVPRGGEMCLGQHDRRSNHFPWHQSWSISSTCTFRMLLQIIACFATTHQARMRTSTNARSNTISTNKLPSQEESCEVLIDFVVAWQYLRRTSTSLPRYMTYASFRWFPRRCAGCMANDALSARLHSILPRNGLADAVQLIH